MRRESIRRPAPFLLQALLMCIALGGCVAQQASAGRAFAQRASAQPVELLVSAAASLTDAMTAIGRQYQKQRPDITLRFNFASSGTLQRQIEQGAPIDVFISAADKNMDELAAGNLIDKSTRRVLAENVLVLIVPKSSGLPISRFKDVTGAAVERVAVGGPAVPAGMRAQEVFTRLGVWPSVRRKAVRGKDVREVLTQVELGNVEAGVVYRTDAASSRRVRVVAVAPRSMHQPIRYPVAVVAGSRRAAQAKAFINYLTGAPARAVLKKYKFVVR